MPLTSIEEYRNFDSNVQAAPSVNGVVNYILHLMDQLKWNIENEGKNLVPPKGLLNLKEHVVIALDYKVNLLMAIAPLSYWPIKNLRELQTYFALKLHERHYGLISSNAK